jgi:AcrR family transcriptional regulator
VRTKGSVTATADNPADARRTIMDVAAREFFTRGYSKTTMAELAEQAGTSVGLLYYHFDSKEGLCFAIWSEYQADQEARVSETLRVARANGVEDPVELLVASVRAYLTGAWEHRDHYWMVHARDVPQRLIDARRKSGDRWKQRNAKALESARPTLSRVMMATLAGFLTEVSLEIVKSEDHAEAAALVDEAALLLTSLLAAFVQVRDSPAARPRRRSSGSGRPTASR